MSRYIDVDDIEWHDHHDADGNISSYKVAYSDEMPEPIDAVLVVRCADCKHSQKWFGDKSRCFLWHDGGIAVFDDGFCSYGRKVKE